MIQNILICFLTATTMALAVVCYRLRRLLKHKEEPSVSIDLPTDDLPANDVQPMHATILVVEDDDVVREYLVRNLSQTFDVLDAADGGEGLDMARENNPDIVISDVMMPVMTGYELCHRLRESVETSHIAIILVSALTERENIIYGLEAGADDYLTKPFDMAILLTRIQTILKRRQAYRDSAASANYVSRIDYKSQIDREFMDRTMDIIKQRSSNSDFSINDLCIELSMSRSSVYNKIKTLTGKGPNEIIKVVRLNNARELLLSHGYNVGEVAFMVGFSDPKYFSTCFKKQFGVSPNKI